MLQKFARIPHYFNDQTYAWLSSGLCKAYGLPDPKVRQRVERPFYELMRIQTIFSSNPRSRMRMGCGQVACDGHEPISVAFLGTWTLGQHNGLLFSKHLIFEDNPCNMEDLGPLPVWQIRKKAEALADKVDLVAVEAPDLLAWQPKAGEWVSGPGSVRMVFDFYPGETWDDVKHRMKGESAALRRLKRENFSYRISHKEEDFCEFYHQMHLPMVTSRYKDYADVINEPGLIKVFHESGFLIQVLDEDGTVLGAVFHYVKDNVLYALLNGVDCGNQELVKRGVLTFGYYAGFQWAHEHGMHRYDSGLCPAMVTSGVYEHKRRWGFAPVIDYWKPFSIVLWSPNQSPAAVRWMAEHPLIPRLARWGGPQMEALYSGLPRD